MADDRTTENEVGTIRGRLPLVALVAAVAVTAVVAGVLAGVQPAGDDELPSDNHTVEPPAEPETVVVDVAGTSSVTISYETPANGTRAFVVEDVAPDLFDSADEWAIIDISALPPALEAVDRGPPGGVVRFGEQALVGNLTASARQSGNVTVTVVAPARKPIEPARKSYFLTEYLSPYALGANQSVVLVAAPRALPHRGAMYADGTGYVTRRGFWDGDVGSVWIHEYLHAQQSFALDDGMEWFREASAEYLAYRIMQEQYVNVTNGNVLERLDAEQTYPDSPLSNRSRWAAEDVAYTRGVRLLYAVDATVRERSGGESTLFDVFREMNGRTDSVSIAEFQRIVERHSGQTEPWIRSAITASGPMDRYRDSTAAVFTSTETKARALGEVK